MHVYEGSNHSLETEDTRQNIKILQDVMRITMKYIKYVKFHGNFPERKSGVVSSKLLVNSITFF